MGIRATIIKRHGEQATPEEISSGCSRATTVENFLSRAVAPVLATSNFIASNRLLNPELPAYARALHPGERFSRNLEAISRDPLSPPPPLPPSPSPPPPLYRAQRYKYVTA